MDKAAEARVRARLEKRLADRRLSRNESQNGLDTFPESAIRPKTEANNIAQYCVSWWYTNKKGKKTLTGNSYARKDAAIRVVKAKIADGTFAGTRTTYCAGYLF